MADPLSQLARPIGPRPPLLAHTAPAPGPHSLALVLVVACVGLLVLAAAGVWWWRRRWLRGLARVTRLPGARSAPDVSDVAEALAVLARHHQVQAPAPWWDTLDRLCFGRPRPDDSAVLQRLLIEARAFAPRDRFGALLPLQAWRRLRPLHAILASWRS